MFGNADLNTQFYRGDTPNQDSEEDPTIEIQERKPKLQLLEFIPSINEEIKAN